jgi:hypothetical protein
VSISFDKVRDRNHEQAEALFRRKEDHRQDGELPLTEYEAGQRAMREKTARLKALRLARDAALVTVEPVAKKRSAHAKIGLKAQIRSATPLRKIKP